MAGLVKIRLLAMIDGELKQNEKSLSNERIWLQGCTNASEYEMIQENIREHEHLRDILVSLREKVVEEELDV